ncbi:MAG: hypothetical protein ACTSWY_04020, partial [Promethearchaeota archaeon]
HAKLRDLAIFYIKFGLANLKEVLTYIALGFLPIFISRRIASSFIITPKNKRLYKYIIFLRLNSIFRGFLIGIKRKLNKNCKRNLVRDYIFIKKHEPKIQTLKLKGFHFFLSF